MNDHDPSIDRAIERLFGEAATAFPPPAGLKEEMRRRMAENNEQRDSGFGIRDSATARLRRTLWIGAAAAAATILAVGLAAAWHWWPAPTEPLQVASTEGVSVPIVPAPVAPPSAPVAASKKGPPPGAEWAPSKPAYSAAATPPPPPPAPPMPSASTKPNKLRPEMKDIAPDRPSRPARASREEGPAEFSEGLAARRGPNNRIGFIDRAGKWVIQPMFDYNMTSFHDGLALVEVENPPTDPQAHPDFTDDYDRFFVDRTGQVVPIPSIDEKGKKFRFGAFGEGLAVIYQNDKSGYINRQGKVVIPVELGYAQPFSEGLALVKPPANAAGVGVYVYIDPGGKIVLPLKGLLAYAGGRDGDFREGLAPVAKEVEGKRKWGFIGHDGQFVIEPQFNDVRGFSEGLAAVSVGAQWGYIDRTGKVVIAPQFDWAAPFSEGLARVQTGLAGAEPVYAFIDTTGKVAIPSEQCGSGESFSEGLAHTYLPGRPGRRGYIDHTGKLVIDFGR
jgi:hypothetical protein